jgi:hypothetical protein
VIGPKISPASLPFFREPAGVTQTYTITIVNDDGRGVPPGTWDHGPYTVNAGSNKDVGFASNSSDEDPWWIDQFTVDGVSIPGAIGLTVYIHHFTNVQANHTIHFVFGNGN